MLPPVIWINRGGCQAPLRVANHEHAAAVLHADHKRAADHAGHDGDRLRIGQQRSRNLVLRHHHRLREHVGRVR